MDLIFPGFLGGSPYSSVRPMVEQGMDPALEALPVASSSPPMLKVPISRCFSFDQ